jgi:hypothetical protein
MSEYITASAFISRDTGERHLLLWADGKLPNAIRTISDWAGDPAIALSWYECAVWMSRIRRGDGVVRVKVYFPAEVR